MSTLKSMTKNQVIMVDFSCHEILNPAGKGLQFCELQHCSWRHWAFEGGFEGGNLFTNAKFSFCWNPKSITLHPLIPFLTYAKGTGWLALDVIMREQRHLVYQKGDGCLPASVVADQLDLFPLSPQSHPHLCLTGLFSLVKGARSPVQT